jgi:flagellar biosynthesis protein FliQ
VNADTVNSLATQALTIALEVSMPFLLAGLVVGLLVSIFQAVTSIQEQTLSFIPKILVIGAVLAIGGPWMLDQMLTYTQNLYTNIPNLVGP